VARPAVTTLRDIRVLHGLYGALDFRLSYFDLEKLIMSDLAKRLWQARVSGEALPNSTEAEIADLDRAYALQAEQLPIAGVEIGGAKLGATNDQAQALMDLPEPFFGWIFKPFISANGAEVALFPAHTYKIESEFAVTLGKALPARNEPYRREEIERAITSVSPSFEVVGLRIEGSMEGAGRRIIADGAGNAGVVLGAPVSDWSKPDLDAQKIALRVNGDLITEGGTSATSWSDLVEAVSWAANHRGAAGVGLKAGDIVMTGTLTGAAAIAPGDVVSADFGDFGSVEARFTLAGV